MTLAKKKFLNKLNLIKKYNFLKQIKKTTFKLKYLLTIKQQYKNTSLLLVKKKTNNFTDKKFLITYIINFFFSPKNTFLNITDTLGNIKFRYSAGLVGINGKQKKSRALVLNRLFNILKKIKIILIKNKPVALHLNNVGFYKFLIIKKLKKEFFIKIIKSYEIYPYNGCRKKKKLHKRQRIKKRKRKNG